MSLRENRGNGGFNMMPYTLGELASFYDVDVRTFSKWLLPFIHLIGTRIGRYYNVLQVRVIVKHLGAPGEQMPEKE